MTDQQIENARIAEIIKAGRFLFNGTDYTVDTAAMRSDPSNYVAAERPVKFLHGVDADGVKVKVFAYNCVIGTVDEPDYVTDTTLPEQEVDDQPQDEPVFVEPIEPEVEPDPKPRNRAKKFSE